MASTSLASPSRPWNGALRWHVSSLNVKSSAIPPDWKPAFNDFQKRMGYRFEPRRVEYPAVVRAGADALVEERVAVPALPPGKYRLRTALLDPRTHKPAIALGIAGRTPDGWYDLGEISVVDNSESPTPR